MDGLQIRWMIRRDMPEVLNIDAACYPIGLRWDEEAYLTCLRQRNCIGMVAEDREKIIGFMLYEFLKQQLHVLNFAVHPDYWRSGVGAAMVEKLKAKLSQQRRKCIVAKVRESNLPAQMFFRSQGFESTTVLRNFYAEQHGGEDAYQFRFCIEPQRPTWTNRIKGLIEERAS